MYVEGVERTLPSRDRQGADQATLAMYVTGVERAEPLAKRTERGAMKEQEDDMVQRAESNPNAIIYGTFHKYLFDEA
jgi:hypothetical protein